jgi:hypothetical protein
MGLTHLGTIAQDIGTIRTDADRLSASWGEHTHVRLSHKAIAVRTDRHIGCFAAYCKHLTVRFSLLANVKYDLIYQYKFLSITQSL